MSENALNAVDDAQQAAALAVEGSGSASVEGAPSAELPPVVVEFKHVSKRYKLYSSDRARLLGLFSKKVKYKTINASNDLSFTVRKGERVALLGTNGAGKSTILKMITGVSYPTEGEIVVNGRVSALLELKAGFDRNLTGRENIYLRGQIMGMSNEEIKKLEPKVVKFADLGDYIDQPMRTYSSGMKSRLGFAFASSVNPEILIVDEALSVGDKRFRSKCRRRVNKMAAKEGLTLLFVTHSTSSARKFCNRGIVLEKGTILFDGPIDDAIAFYEKDEATEEKADIAAETAEEQAFEQQAAASSDEAAPAEGAAASEELPAAQTEGGFAAASGKEA